MKIILKKYGENEICYPPLVPRMLGVTNFHKWVWVWGIVRKMPIYMRSCGEVGANCFTPFS